MRGLRAPTPSSSAKAALFSHAVCSLRRHHSDIYFQGGFVYQGSQKVKQHQQLCDFINLSTFKDSTRMQLEMCGAHGPALIIRSHY